ncbi:MAG: sensor histidine kinase, partial [Geminicoccales bacterium]
MRNKRLRLPRFFRSLSARLLLLTVFFVMLAEVLIYAPSIGRFRKVYLEERISAAHLASLAVEATPDNMVSEELAQELLDHAGAHRIVLRGGRVHKLMLARPVLPPVDAVYDLREGEFFPMIMEAFGTLFSNRGRVLRVMGASPKDPRVQVEVLIDEKPMRDAMIDYSWRILALSIVISLMTATLVYLSLQLLTVKPIRRITESMTAYRNAPEDLSKVIRPSPRSDEVGIAERELHGMQVALRAALRQKARLAAVGTAVTKINHDLRSILATASLVSDRIAALHDPEAKRLAPQVIDAIDRAVNLCSQIVQYAKEEMPR